MKDEDLLTNSSFSKVLNQFLETNLQPSSP